MQSNKKSKTKYACELCNKAYSHHSSAIRHMQTHVKEQLVPKCIKTKPLVARVVRAIRPSSVRNKTVKNLQTHMTNSLNQPSMSGNHRGLYFKCKLCNIKMKTNVLLRHHIRAHITKIKIVLDAKSAVKKKLKAIDMPGANLDKVHKCSKCLKQFKYPSSLYRHRTLHFNIRKYKCQQCSLSFRRNEHLNRHLMAHTSKLQFQCRRCAASFRSQYGLMAHMRLHNNQNTFSISCEKCKLVESTVNVPQHLPLMINRRVAQNKQISNCTFLNCTTQSSRQVSEQTSAANKCLCDMCNKREPIFFYGDVPNAACHAGELSSLYKFRRCARQTDLQQTSTETKLDHKCNVCGQVCVSEVQLRRHMTAHANRGLHQTSVKSNTQRIVPNSTKRKKCDEFINRAGFASCLQTRNMDNVDLNHNLSVVSPAVSSSPHELVKVSTSKLDSAIQLCKLRGLSVISAQRSKERTCTFATQRVLQQLDDSLMRCELRNEEFESRNCWERHLPIHEQKKEKLKQAIKNNVRDVSQNVFKCSECLTVCKTESYYYGHLRMHLGLEPYLCKVCGSHFPSPSKLRRHAESHSGQSSFRCSRCPATFCKKIGLVLHKRIHENPGPIKDSSLKCGICNFVFSSNFLLRRHVTLRHTEKKQFTCDVCQAQFEKHCDLHWHLILHKELLKNTGNEQTSAPVMSATKLAVDDNSIICEFCKTVFSYKSSLNRHMKNCHDKFRCRVCNTYAGKNSLSSLSDHKDHKYICVKCSAVSEKELDVSSSTVMKLVSKLLEQLVEESTRKSENLCNQPVLRQLSALVDFCGESPAECANSSVEECVIENLKLLFTLSVGKEATELLLRFKTMEGILTSILRQNDYVI